MTGTVEVADLEPVLLTVFPLEPVDLVTEAELPQPRPGIDGDDGWSVQVGRSTTHIVTRQVRGTVVSAWVDIIALAELVGGSGPAGARMELRATSTHLERRWVQDGTAPTAWVQVLALSTLKGKDAVLPEIEASAETVPYGQLATLETSIDPETGRLLFAAQIPAGRDSTIASFVAQSVAFGQSARIESTGPDWARNITLFVPTGGKGDKGDQGASGMPNVDVVGEGMPNGSVQGEPLTVYRDKLKSNGARLWIKDTGSGTSGWIVLDGDTGLRDITSLQDPQFMTIASSKVIAQRTPEGVQVTGRCAGISGDTTQHSPRIYLPAGFWPEASLNTMPGEAVLGLARPLSAATPVLMGWNWYIAMGALRGFSTAQPFAKNSGFVFTLNFKSPAAQAWPTL